MTVASKIRSTNFFILFAAMVVLTTAANAYDNPYKEISNWAKTVDSRKLGSVSCVYADAVGNIWILDRCGQNSCVDRDDVAPIHMFNAKGQWVKSFGEGMFVFPHGLTVDPDGNIWVTDARGEGPRGHQVFKFSPDGEVLMILGKAGVAGDGPDHFNAPTDVVVAANGGVFVSDGHTADSNNRVLKFSSDGRFIKSWGGSGTGPGKFLVPHALAMDSQGRVFVADRDNNRIQIFDQEGKFIAAWKDFGRPSGIFVSEDDTIYVSDNQSNRERNPGWRRGIRVGSARDGSVSAFIPDPDFDPENSGATGSHGITANAIGEIFGADVYGQVVKKYVRR